jgi:hypothetical protein
MIKVEAIQNFELKDFEKLNNIQRATNGNRQGWLYCGDKFECDEEMVKYLTGNNDKGVTVIKVIEVEPKKENREEPKIIETIETSVGTFGYGPVEVKAAKPKTTKKKKSSKK